MTFSSLNWPFWTPVGPLVDLDVLRQRVIPRSPEKRTKTQKCTNVYHRNLPPLIQLLILKSVIRSVIFELNRGKTLLIPQFHQIRDVSKEFNTNKDFGNTLPPSITITSTSNLIVTLNDIDFLINLSKLPSKSSHKNSSNDVQACFNRQIFPDQEQLCPAPGYLPETDKHYGKDLVSPLFCQFISLLQKKKVCQ